MPNRRKYKGKTPLHLREFIYTYDEAMAVAGMCRRTFYLYLVREKVSLPTTKAFIANWVRRHGYPRKRCKGNTITLLSEQRIRAIRDMKKQGFSTRKIAPILGIGQARVQELAHKPLPCEEYEREERKRMANRISFSRQRTDSLRRS